MGTELPTKVMLGQTLVLMQMTFLNNVREVGRLILSRTSCYRYKSIFAKLIASQIYCAESQIISFFVIMVAHLCPRLVQMQLYCRHACKMEWDHSADAAL
jgi:hypothetical protein